jgi:hypothetical protein
MPKRMALKANLKPLQIELYFGYNSWLTFSCGRFIF